MNQARGSRQPLLSRWKAVVATLGALLILGLVAGCGASSTGDDKRDSSADDPTEADAPDSEDSESEDVEEVDKEPAPPPYDRDACQAIFGDFIDVLASIDARLGVGMQFQEYLKAVGNASVAYEKISFGDADLKCLQKSGVSSEAAFNRYRKAATKWNDCIGDIYCDMDVVTPGLQKHWSAATKEVAKAQRGI